MANDETKLALLELKFIRLAEDVAIMKIDQTKTNEWISAHKMEELSRHNMIMNAIEKVSNSIEEDRKKTEKKSIGRLSIFDRTLVSITTLIGLVVFLNWLYNIIKGTPISP